MCCGQNTLPPPFPLECAAYLTSNCVSYKGPTLVNTNILNGDSLTLVLQKIDALISGGSGGLQGLQSVLDVSGNATFTNGSDTTTYEMTSDSLYAEINQDTYFGYLSVNHNIAAMGSSDGTRNSSISMEGGDFDITYRVNGYSSMVRITIDDPLPNAVTYIRVPAKSPSFDLNTYTISMIEDIKSLGTIIPTYLNNAAAVSGGLAVGGTYQTPTGEVRIRV